MAALAGPGASALSMAALKAVMATTANSCLALAAT